MNFENENEENEGNRYIDTDEIDNCVYNEEEIDLEKFYEQRQSYIEEAIMRKSSNSSIVMRKSYVKDNQNKLSINLNKESVVIVKRPGSATTKNKENISSTNIKNVDKVLSYDEFKFTTNDFKNEKAKRGN